MALTSGLGVWFYTSPTTTAYPLIARDYSRATVGLHFTNTAPGGFAEMTATIRTANPRLVRPELQPFSRVAIRRGTDSVWLGEVAEPELGLQATDGEYIAIRALGWQNALLDDPRNDAYVNQTVQQMATQQLSSRSVYLPIDQDTAGIFPDNPAATYSPAFAGNNMQEVVATLVTLAGDYQWGIWAHPRNLDAANFPTAQLLVHVRDAATVAYQAFASSGDVIGWRIIPSGQRAYNVVEIGYNDPTTGIGTATYTDPRLGGGGAQGNAPFRRRAYYRDLSGVSTVTAAQAQAIANAYGAIMQNVTNKVEVTLRRVRDATGTPIPLALVQADRNLSLPELIVRGRTIATAPVAGTDLFYIKQVSYDEAGDGIAITLQCDNFVDTVNTTVARLQLQSDTLARIGSVTAGAVQALGASFKSKCGGTFQASAGSLTFSHAIAFPAQMTQAPTSLTLTGQDTANFTALGANDLDVYGANVFWQSTASGLTKFVGTYQTVGNCLLDVDEARGTFGHHCDVCDTTRRGLALGRDLRADTTHGAEPGKSALTYDCPICAGMGTPVHECFNTRLGPDDETEVRGGHFHHGWRAAQAALIRRAMRHPAVGLATHEPATAGQGGAA